MRKRHNRTEQRIPSGDAIHATVGVNQMAVQHTQPPIRFDLDRDGIGQIPTPWKLEPLQLWQHFQGTMFISKPHDYQFFHLRTSLLVYVLGIPLNPPRPSETDLRESANPFPMNQFASPPPPRTY